VIANHPYLYHLLVQAFFILPSLVSFDTGCQSIDEKNKTLEARARTSTMSDGVSSQNCMCVCVCACVCFLTQKKTFDERRKLNEDSHCANGADEEKESLFMVSFSQMPLMDFRCFYIHLERTNERRLDADA
jgi:hypothetical protein